VKTIEIEIAVMGYLGIRTNLIVPNVSWGIAMLHECDLLSLSKSNYATEIEIKVSKSDLLKDGEKKHGHIHNHIAQLFFAVPTYLEKSALKTIPARSGLFVIEKHRNEHPALEGIYEWYTTVKQIRQCERNKNAVKWNDSERLQLARLGAMRILGLKKKIAK